jgi:hypothetical protein
MFNLFKRKRRRRPVEKWEIQLLSNTIQKLPADFHSLLEQLHKNLFSFALIGYSKDFPDYVAFSFNPDVINDFENRRGLDFQITNIQVFDSLNLKSKLFTIFISSDVICGYKLVGADDIKIDVNNIDVSNYTLQKKDNPNYDKVKILLKDEDLELINPGQVYEVSLDGKLYYHLMDTEDGDFVGIDTDGIIYHITHDPYKITPINNSLKNYLNL